MLVREDLLELRDIALADPDGNFEQQDYYKESVHLLMPNRKQQQLVRIEDQRSGRVEVAQLVGQAQLGGQRPMRPCPCCLDWLPFCS